MASNKRPSLQKGKITSAGGGQQTGAGLSGFLNIPTLFQHVQNNLLCAGRHSYFMRVIFVAKHKSGSSVLIGREQIKDSINELVSASNKEVAYDKLTGLILIWERYSIHVVEGSEDCVGNFMKRLGKIDEETFKRARIVLVYNNVNQRLLSKMYYKYAKQSDCSETMSNPLTDKENDILTFSLMKKLTDLCIQLNNDETESASKAQPSLQLGAKYEPLVPSTELLDQILTIDLLQTVREFSAMYGTIPDFYSYNEHVWPIPQDLTPNHVFDWNKYDINLTFGSHNKFV